MHVFVGRQRGIKGIYEVPTATKSDVCCANKTPDTVWASFEYFASSLPRDPCSSLLRCRRRYDVATCRPVGMLHPALIHGTISFFHSTFHAQYGIFFWYLLASTIELFFNCISKLPLMINIKNFHNQSLDISFNVLKRSKMINTIVCLSRSHIYNWIDLWQCRYQTPSTIFCFEFELSKISEKGHCSFVHLCICLLSSKSIWCSHKTRIQSTKKEDDIQSRQWRWDDDDDQCCLTNKIIIVFCHFVDTATASEVEVEKPNSTRGTKKLKSEMAFPRCDNFCFSVSFNISSAKYLFICSLFPHFSLSLSFLIVILLLFLYKKIIFPP